MDGFGILVEFHEGRFAKKILFGEDLIPTGLDRVVLLS